MKDDDGDLETKEGTDRPDPIEDDPIDLLAAELARLDVEPVRAEEIRARAHAELARATSARAPGLRRALGRTYRRVERPVAGALAVLYLSWALQIVLAAGG